MFRKSYFTKFLTAAIFLIGASAATAQYTPVSGKVQMKKADGSVAPVQGALVEVFRVDIKSSLPPAKTDKKGIFSFAGLPVGAILALAVSAPGASPGYLPNIRPGQNTESLLVTLTEGDGKRWTEQEVRDAIKGSNTSSSSSAETTRAPTEEEKKAAAEYEKKRLEVESKNKDIENKNTVIQKALADGNAAFKAKDYDTAITRYTEGINADPEYIGSAPVLLNNRGVALKIRGVDAYNAAVKQTDADAKAAGVAKAKKDIGESLESYNKSWMILKGATTAEIDNPANHERAKYDALAGLTEMYRIIVFTKLDPTKAANSKEAFEAYFAVETDPVKKAKSQLTYADIMRETGDSEKAIAAYRAVLAVTPDNGEAMAGLGLSLFNSGVVASDKAQMQEGLNFMTKYIETSPILPTDSQSVKEFKASVKEAVDYLKNTEKLAAQKVTTKKKP